MRSLKWKLVLIYVALVFIVMVISGTFIVVQTTYLETERLKEELYRHAQLIYGEVITQSAPERFNESLNQISGSPLYSSEIQSSILDETGRTLAANAFQGDTLPSYNNASVISALSGTEKYDKGVWADASGAFKEWLNYAAPYELNGQTYVIYLQTDIAPINEKAASTTAIILVASLLALIFAVVIGILFAETITRPIVTLTKKAKDIARGKLMVTAPVNSHDEIGQLAKNFNFMSIELSNTVSAISSEKNKLETLLHNMTDGVLAFDRRGNVIHANAASKEMLGGYCGSLADIERLFKVRIDVHELLESGEPLRTQASFGIKYLVASFAPYTDVTGRAEGIVAVLQDSTKQKMLDDMRKEFVANVSHEIRTPLTTIKSYAETLIDGALDDRETARGFLETIDREADRMSLLVTDLLQLSSLDNRKYVMSFEDVDLTELVASNIENCRILAENKNQRLIYDKPNCKFIVKADRGRATQVITNIISNAIKYSQEGAVIYAGIEEIKDFVLVSVEDNGMGIPEEDLDRIFERFYRVDKARSRAMGGTGLGLAIAKEIMEAMNGFIVARSRLGEGTAMTLYFSVNM